MSLANQAYIQAQQQHLNECEQDLKLLSGILAERAWSRLEKVAAERVVHLLIESCIGIAKHWCKSATGQVAPEPRKAIEALQVAGVVDDEIPWRKVIGLRNVLVHDYLEADPDILKSVIQNAYYEPLLRFARTGLKQLDA